MKTVWMPEDFAPYVAKNLQWQHLFYGKIPRTAKTVKMLLCCYASINLANIAPFGEISNI